MTFHDQPTTSANQSVSSDAGNRTTLLGSLDRIRIGRHRFNSINGIW